MQYKMENSNSVTVTAYLAESNMQNVRSKSSREKYE